MVWLQALGSRLGWGLLGVLGSIGIAVPSASAGGECPPEDELVACGALAPRIMILLDAGSSMLDVGGVAGAESGTPWDWTRAALASGGNPMFDVPVPTTWERRLEDVAHVGVAVFGNAGEEQVLIQYGACTKDNVEWALDPSTSCVPPGCADPWGGPPITWTFFDGSMLAPPLFQQPTISHMPRCDSGATPGACAGSGGHLHLGLGLVACNQQAYASSPPPEYPADASTQYVNILVTDGGIDSTDEQVAAELAAMYQANVITYVIGLGAGEEADALACWGSGGSGIPCAGGTIPAFHAASQADLEMAFTTVIETVNFEPCCVVSDCAATPEPGPITGLPTSCPPSSTTGPASDSSASDDASTSDADVSDTGDGAQDESAVLSRGCACNADGMPRESVLFGLALVGALRRRRKATVGSIVCDCARD